MTHSSLPRGLKEFKTVKRHNTHDSRAYITRTSQTHIGLPRVSRVITTPSLSELP